MGTEDAGPPRGRELPAEPVLHEIAREALRRYWSARARRGGGYIGLIHDIEAAAAAHGHALGGVPAIFEDDRTTIARIVSCLREVGLDPAPQPRPSDWYWYAQELRRQRRQRGRA